MLPSKNRRTQSETGLIGTEVWEGVRLKTRWLKKSVSWTLGEVGIKEREEKSRSKSVHVPGSGHHLSRGK